MAQIAIHLLGSFEVRLDTQPVTNFGYDKVRALLAYLAVESRRAHRRETLATLLWPDQPADVARHSLRQALSLLRRALGEERAAVPYLIVDRDSIQVNAHALAFVDVEF
ncbi:MAG TPA: winged helix-turn-helix domain-containing protein, partial [Anaerolineae bacterium]|nr:winged helix-turn-helix domain-containing protein [Anaerolineae bacterium]